MEPLWFFKRAAELRNFNPAHIGTAKMGTLELKLWSLPLPPRGEARGPEGGRPGLGVAGERRALEFSGSAVLCDPKPEGRQGRDARGVRRSALQGKAGGQRRRRLVQLGRSALRIGVGYPVRNAARVVAFVTSPVRVGVRRARFRRAARREHNLAHRQQQWTSETFPRQLCHPDREMKRCQELAAVGNRYWGRGLDPKSMLRVKLYDFAMYFDGESLRRHAAASKYLGRPVRDVVVERTYYEDLVKHSDTALSVVLVPARNVPLGVISSEYGKILRRRIDKVGGDRVSDEADILRVLNIFREDTFPRGCLHKGSLRKGTVMTFRKKGGVLDATADGISLGKVDNPSVCAAFFDMYMGSEPVHAGARIDAGISAMQMMRSRRGV